MRYKSINSGVSGYNLKMEINYSQFMQFFLNNRRPREADKLMTLPLSRCPGLQETLADLHPCAQPIFHALFTPDEEPAKQVNLRALLPLQERKTAMPVCNKLLVVNEAVYRCYECTTHESAVLCIRCFERGNHQGHRFSKIDSGGGNCDCGNPDAILEAGFCADHKGKADEMLIDEEEELHFRRHVIPVFVWALKLYQGGLKKETEVLLTQLVEVLDALNNESLYYNTLTNKLLFNWENQMIDHLFILGTNAGPNSPLARKATELFLKMFSLELFKENLAAAYLRAYNRLPKFEDTKFESLFIQLFANNDLVERVVSTANISLDPREREYNPTNYYGSLIFMGSIKERAARAFFKPIIQAGGLHCMFIEQIQKCVELGMTKLEDIISENVNTENNFYNVSKVIARLIRSTPELLEAELRNHYNSVMKFHFIKNRIAIVYHRVFAMLVYLYFNCNYDVIDMEVLRGILRISPFQMKQFLRKLAKCFLHCLKEYGRCIGNSGFPRHSFEKYVDLYCRSSHGNRVILLDMIGIKFCALAFHRTKDSEGFGRVIIEALDEEANHETLISYGDDDEWDSDEEEEEEAPQNPNQPKSRQSSVVFFLGWMNTISLLIEATLYDRAEVSLAAELEINDNQAITELYENQFKRLMLNARELTMHELESMGIYWFSKPIDRAVVAKYATFDKAKRKFVVKEDVSGIPIKRELLKSFTKTPDHFLRASEQLAMDINHSVRKWRDLLFSTTYIPKLYKTLINHLRSSLNKEFEKYTKQLANHLKIVNMLFEYDSEPIEDIIDVVIQLASDNEKLKGEISSLFQAEKKEVVEEGQDKEKNEKRKELLKKKKEEKLKNFKNKQNIDKFLSQKEPENENQANETCIICHEHSLEKPLYYLASTFSSNIVYSILKTQGINPYFQSCFHHVHMDCFLSIAHEKERIYCPLCKALTNIVIPTEQNIEDLKVVAISMERINVLFAMEYRQQFKNIYVEIMKSFIQLFFSGTVEEGLISDRQIKIFKLILNVCKQYFISWKEEERVGYLNQLEEVSSKYEKTSKTEYNIGLFIQFIFAIASKYLKSEQITQDVFNQIIISCRGLPLKDLNKCVSLAQKVFNLNSELALPEQFTSEQGAKQLKQYFYTFDPPKSIRALLEQRRLIESENICKLGHQICICLICSWKGCLECNGCVHHTNKAHNCDAIYFNFITGGFVHQYNGVNINLRSLYVNELGLSWMPKYEDDGFFFEIDLYQKILQALKSGNLIQLIRSNYENLKVPEATMWNI